MYGGAFAVLRGEFAQQLQIGFALLFEVIKGVFSIGCRVFVQMELRIIGLELGVRFAQKSVDTRAIAVAFAFAQHQGVAVEQFFEAEAIADRFKKQVEPPTDE
jgi:hypothetical protein